MIDPNDPDWMLKRPDLSLRLGPIAVALSVAARVPDSFGERPDLLGVAADLNARSGQFYLQAVVVHGINGRELRVAFFPSSGSSRVPTGGSPLGWATGLSW